MVQKIALTLGSIFAGIPLLALLLGYIFNFQKFGTPFGNGEWSYFPFIMGNLHWFVCFQHVFHPLSLGGLAWHIAVPFLALLFSSLNFSCVYFPIILFEKFLKKRSTMNR